MNAIHHTQRLAWLGIVLVAALCSGQGCGPADPGAADPGGADDDVPVATACGLHAAYCVEVIGKSPFALAAADLDGDRDQDVAVVNFGTDNVEILFNDGQGRLTPDRKYATGDSPGTIVTGDFNGDGDLDLAVSDAERIRVFFNDGDGQLPDVTNIRVAPDLNAIPQAVAKGDLNGDGVIDLATIAMGFELNPDDLSVSLTQDNVAVFLNTPADGFQSGSVTVIETAFPALSALAVGDLDDDGVADVVVGQTNGHVRILLNRGDGSFDEPITLNIGEHHNVMNLSLADLDGDGRQDVIICDHGDNFEPGDQGGIVVAFNRGAGAFSLANRVPAGDNPSAAEPVDLDGDRDLDLAVANNTSDDITLLFNDGEGAFPNADGFATGDGPTDVVAADLDGDGIPDLAVSHMNSGVVGVYLNDGAGVFPVR